MQDAISFVCYYLLSTYNPIPSYSTFCSSHLESRTHEICLVIKYCHWTCLSFIARVKSQLKQIKAPLKSITFIVKHGLLLCSLISISPFNTFLLVWNFVMTCFMEWCSSCYAILGAKQLGTMKFKLLGFIKLKWKWIMNYGYPFIPYFDLKFRELLPWFCAWSVSLINDFNCHCLLPWPLNDLL